MCNSLFTIDGGMHMRAIVNSFSEYAISVFVGKTGRSKKTTALIKRKKIMQQRDKGKGKGRGKGKGKGAKDKVKKDDGETHKLTTKDIERNTTFIISVRVHNPSWGGGQSKNKLSSFTGKDGTLGKFNIKFSTEDVESIKQWGLMDRLDRELRSKSIKLLKVTDGKRVNKIKCIKGVDCTWSGTAKSDKCTLVIFEGDSALMYAKVFRACHPNGPCQIMLLPTGGKIKNMLECDLDKLVKKPFFEEFKTMMGIVEGVDYTIEENRNDKKYGLRAGNIMIMTDSDKDGQHIKGLILCFINKYYPSLLQHFGTITDYKTKTISVKKGKQEIRFLYEYEFEEWKANTPDYDKWIVTYYKGLGTSDEKEVQDDWNNQKIVNFFKDKHADKNFHLAFHSSQSNQRKDWTTEYIRRRDKTVTPTSFIDDQPAQYISDFINEELVDYKAADILRHMPKRDGLQPTNRKIIYGAIRKWKWWSKPAEKNKMKLVTFAGSIVEKTDYQHGDLCGVIVGMAQDFVGSNNVPYFFPKGMYGSRDAGGKDHAAYRYLYTYPNSWWLKYIFMKRDEDLLRYLPAEKPKKTIEPIIYYPPIPMYAVNGVHAIMSAYNSFIPCCHVLSIVEWLIRRCKGGRLEDIPDIRPFYRKFEGRITIKDDRTKTTVMKDVHSNRNEGRDSRDNRNESRDSRDKSESESDYSRDSNSDSRDKSYKSKKRHGVRYPVDVYKGKYRMITKGIVEDMGPDYGTVTELPVGMWTTSYINQLERWEEEGKIKGIVEESTYRDIKIEIYGLKIANNDPDGTTKENTRRVRSDDFCITKMYSLCNMRILGDDNVPIKLNSLKELMEDFYQWRLPGYTKRMKRDILIIEDKITKLNKKIKYVEAIVDGKLITYNRGGSTIPKAKVIENIDKLGLDREIYTKRLTSDRSYNRESINKMYDELDDLESQLAHAKKIKDVDIWINDLMNIRKTYIGEYGEDYYE